MWTDNHDLWPTGKRFDEAALTTTYRHYRAMLIARDAELAAMWPLVEAMWVRCDHDSRPAPTVSRMTPPNTIAWMATRNRRSIARSRTPSVWAASGGERAEAWAWCLLDDSPLVPVVDVLLTALHRNLSVDATLGHLYAVPSFTDTVAAADRRFTSDPAPP